MPEAKSEEEQLWAEFEQTEKSDKDITADGEEAAHEEPLAPPEEPDIWANAPPDLREAHDAQVKALESAQTEHARRSIEGRIAAYTRRLEERNAAAAQPPAQRGEEAADPLTELAAEYPEIAKPLQEKLAPITEKLHEFDTALQSRQTAADQEMDAELKANEQLLEASFPGWDRYLHDYGAVFGAWIADQPLYLRQAFVTNKEAIIDPYAAIDTLAAFKEFVDSFEPPQPGTVPAAVNQQTGLNPRRAAQLAGSASPYAAASRPTVSGIPQDGDEQQIWNSFREIDPEERKYRNA